MQVHTITFSGGIEMKSDHSMITDRERTLLRPSDVAKRLNISTSFAYRLLQTGEIPVVRIRAACRVRPQDLEKYVERNLHNLMSSD